MCFVWISEQTAIISLYSNNLSVFITEAECVLRGTDWVFKSDGYTLIFRGLKYEFQNRGIMLQDYDHTRIHMIYVSNSWY